MPYYYNPILTKFETIMKLSKTSTAMSLSVQNLKAHGACPDGIEFVEMHGLDSYSLHDLDITGDYNEYVLWLDGKVSCEYTHDENGNVLTRVTLTNGKLTKLTYDERGNKLSSNAVDGIESYVYDENDNMIQYRWQFHNHTTVHKYTYDATGNKLSHECHGLYRKEWTYGENNNVLTYNENLCGKITEYTAAYDSDGNIISYTSDRGYSIKYTYDTRGNLLSVIGGGGPSEVYTYDSNNKMVSYHDSDGYNYTTIDLPKGVLCQVFKRAEIILEIKLK